MNSAHTLQLIGLDADDTLWLTEPGYSAAQEKLQQLLEPYVELALAPSTLSLRTAIGARIELGSHVTIGFRTGLDGDNQEASLTYLISPNLHVRGAYFLRTETIETTLGYRLNESFSWEVVATSRGTVWVRLVGNL